MPNNPVSPDALYDLSRQEPARRRPCAATTDAPGDERRPEPDRAERDNATTHRSDPWPTLRRIEDELVSAARLSNATTGELLRLHKHFSAEAERARRYVSEVAVAAEPQTPEGIEIAMREVRCLRELQKVLERIERELAAPGRLVNATMPDLLKLLAWGTAALNTSMSHLEDTIASTA